MGERPVIAVPHLMAGLAAAVIASIALVDLNTPETVNLAILYSLPLLVCATGRNRRILWGLTGVCLVLSYAVFYWKWDAEGHDRRVLASLLMNRSLAGLVLLLTGALLHHLIGAMWQIERGQEAILRQNQDLQAANAELAAREQTIGSQNEALQARNQENEHQSEELRRINAELADRQTTLRRLVELSRSITAGLTRDEMLQRVCRAALELIDGADAVAILEREQEHLVVHCQHGFGESGPVEPKLPFEGSFASRVIQGQHTEQIEDLGLRPELLVMHPTQGEAFRSVLATPLWVRGQCVGTLQVYSRQSRRWTDQYVAMIESLGAQTSISLETIQLIEGLESQRLRFEAVFRTLPIGMLVAEDPECKWVRGNAAAAATYNVSPEANFSILARPEQSITRTLYKEGRPLSPEEHPLVRAVKGREHVHGQELDVVLATGQRFTFLFSAAPILDSAGQVVGGVCAQPDITELKQLQRQLEARRREAEESSARKTRFLAAVSHDIRTPANAINLLAELIRRSADNPALTQELPQHVNDLQASAVMLVDLVSDVLDLARLDAGGIDLQEAEISLDTALSEEVRHLIPLARQKELALEVEPLENPIYLRADRVKLGRVVSNLISNAIKFTHQGGVFLRAGVAADGRPFITVRDTGVGIAPQHIPRIFDEFFQLHNPERDHRKGIGLGLTICARLIQAMGGQINVESELGQGSTFTVFLPASAVVPHQQRQERQERQALAGHNDPSNPRRLSDGQKQLAGLRVLLVEDHSFTRRATTHLLSSHGAEVIEAADGHSALRLLYESRPQVLLLDMKLPDLDGAEVLKAIRNRRPESLKNVLVLTGDTTTDRAEEVRQLGADALIPKPIDFARLISQMSCLPDGNGDSAKTPTPNPER